MSMKGIAGRHGDHYQVKLLLLFLKEGFKSNGNLRIFTEESEWAGVFDDVIFGWQDSDGKYKYRLIQVKHKVDGMEETHKKVVSHNNFTAHDGNSFSLPKYFLSYCGIMHFGNIHDFILYSNADFPKHNFHILDMLDLHEEAMEGICVRKLTPDHVFMKEPYKLLPNQTIKDLFHKAIGMEGLAIELVKAKNECFNKDVLKFYQIALAHEVIEIDSTNENIQKVISCEFQKKFQEGKELSQTAKKLRNFIAQNYLNGKKMSILKDKSNESVFQSPNLTAIPSDKDLNSLAKRLISSFLPDEEKIIGKKVQKIQETTDLKIVYAYFLSKFVNEVIDLNTDKFQHNFIINQDLSISAETLREKILNAGIFADKLKFPKSFKEVFHLNQQEIKNVRELSSKFLEFNNDRKNEYYQLAGHVLVYDEESTIDSILMKKLLESKSTMRIRDSFFDEESTIDSLLMKKLLESKSTMRIRDSFFDEETTFERKDLNEFKIHLKKCYSIQELKAFRFNLEDDTFQCVYERQILSLPSESKFEELIVSFCENFVLAMRQADDNEIDEQLKKDFANIFNLEYSEFIADHLICNINKWINNVKSVSLTHEELEKFIKNIKDELLKNKISNKSLEFCSNLKNYNIYFKENCNIRNMIEEFLNQNSTNVLQIFTETSLLSSIKVLQAIKATMKYDMDDSFIFLPEDMLDLNVFKAFKSPHCNNLLIIKYNKSNEQNIIPHFEIIHEILPQAAKKVLLITEILNEGEKDTTEEIVSEIFDAYSSFVDCAFYNDLKNKELVQKKKIIFQGNYLFLDQIINTESFFQQLNGKMLLKVLTSECIEIDNRKLPMFNNGENYIKRNFHLIHVSDEIFDERAKLHYHIFCIDGLSEEEVKDYLNEKSVQNKRILDAEFFKYNKLAENGMGTTFINNMVKNIESYFLKISNATGSNFIILDKDQPQMHFNNICNLQAHIKVLQKFKFHWVKVHEVLKETYNNGPNEFIKECIWMDSYFCFKSPHNIRNVIPIRYGKIVDEDTFLSYFTQNQIGIICDSAGAGKSTTIEKMLQQVDKTLWSIRIVLNQHTQLFAWYSNESDKITNSEIKFNFGAEYESYSELLLQALLSRKWYKSETFSAFLKNHGENVSLEQYFFLYFFHHGKLLILLDGFDEISPRYTELILQAVINLRNETKNKVWITSRKNLESTLEKTLDTFSYWMEPLSDENQRHILISFWEAGLKNKNNSAQFDAAFDLARYIVDHFAKLLPFSKHFLGTPLQLKMIAEIFDQETEPNKREIPNLFEFYHKFVEKKFLRFFNKTSDISKDYGEKMFKMLFDYEQKIHEILGFLQLTSDIKEDVSKLVTEKELKLADEWKTDFMSGIENVGLIEKLTTTNEAIFWHLTYAEYFCACYLVKKLEKAQKVKESYFIILNKIFEKNVSVFVFTWKHLIGSRYIKPDAMLNGLPPIVFATQLGLLNCVKEFMLDIKLNQMFPRPDELQKTLLHYAVEFEQINVVIYILIPAWTQLLQKSGQNIDVFKKTLLNYIDKKDKNKKMAVDYASKNTNIAKLIVEIRESCAHQLLSNRGDRSRQYYEGRIDDRYECHHVQQLLFFASPSIMILVLNTLPQNHFYDLMFQNKVNIFDDICGREDLKNVDKMQLFKYFLDKIVREGNVQIAETLFHALIENNCFNLSSSLMQEMKEFKFSEQFLSTLLCTACEFHNITNVKILCSKFDAKIICRDKFVIINKKTNLEILKYIFPRICGNINEPNEAGITLLSHAVQQECEFEIIKFLVGNLNISDEDGENSIIHALKKENYKVIEYLIENCDILEPSPASIFEYYKLPKPSFYQNIEGKSRLIHAVENKSFEQTFFLLQIGADSNESDQEGNTPLHYACKKDLLEITKLLLNFGANFEKQNIAKHTPLVLCPENSDTQILMEKVAASFKNILCEHSWTNATNAKNQTLWHIAAKEKNFKLMKIHPKSEDNFKILNRKDITGNAALHYAAENCDKQIVMYMLEHGAYYNLKNSENKTPLELAEAKNNIEIKILLQKIEHFFNAVDNDTLHNKEEWKKFYSFYDSSFYLVLEYKNMSGKTLLHQAVINKRPKIVDKLIKLHLNPNLQDEDECTPLYYAFKNNDMETIRLLLTYDIKISEKDLRISRSEKSKCLSEKIQKLFLCMKNKDAAQIEHIVDLWREDSDLLINAKNSDGQNLFLYALDTNNFEFVVSCLKKGAIVEQTTNCCNKKIQQLLDFIKTVFESVEHHTHTPSSILQLFYKHNYTDIFLKVQFRNEKNQRAQTLLDVATSAFNTVIKNWCRNPTIDYCNNKEGIFDFCGINWDSLLPLSLRIGIENGVEDCID